MRIPKFVANTGRGTEADVKGHWLDESRIKHSNRRRGKAPYAPSHHFGGEGMVRGT